MADRPDSVLFQWLASLDTLSYYELLQVDERAELHEIQEGFRKFAVTFHPDGHAAGSADERKAAHTIFKRGTEAHRVLSNMDLRALYDEELSRGTKRSVKLSSALPPKPGSSLAPKARKDLLKSPAAVPFLLKAEEHAKRGEYAQAKLQLSIAMQRDFGNPVLEEFQKELEEKSKKR
ncbi:MAG: DnaJ domain-containing protein [Polyangiaceae bacterium]